MTRKPPIVYMGTPAFAVPALNALLQEGFEVVEVLTQPDRPAGRGKKLQMSQVKKTALDRGLKVSHPQNITQHLIKQKQVYTSCVFIVCAFGRILSRKVLSIPKQTINIHASLLPKYRGAAPIHAAIKNGETKTGVSIMKVVYELDAGDVMLSKDIAIQDDDDLESMTDKLSHLGAQALVEALNLLEEDKAIWVPQDEAKVSYAPKIDSSMNQIKWDQNVVDVHCFIKSFSPKPGAITSLNGKPLKIISSFPAEGPFEKRALAGSLEKTKKQLYVACHDGWLTIDKVQLQGKKTMPIKDFLNGYQHKIEKFV